MNSNSASFRDPNGFVFEFDGEVYRNIHRDYQFQYEFLIHSGLLEKLTTEGLLVNHQMLDGLTFNIPESFGVIKPERIPLISYPYEWCFSQLKEAALLTLNVLRISLEHDMILKDGNAFNVQFKGHRPIFIDTLSFVRYEEGQSWNGYKQFCEQFLAPLALAAHLGVELLSLTRLGVEGVSLKMTSTLLPLSTWLKPGILFNIHLHARTVGHYGDQPKNASNQGRKISKRNLIALTEHLINSTSRLNLKTNYSTQWKNYRSQTHYSNASREDKAEIVKEFVSQARPRVVWDIGANDGFFSRIIENNERLILSLDSDSLAIEKNFYFARETKSQTVYPLLFDIVNPTPDLGWGNEERSRLNKRAKPDLIMALALIHHLVITYNIPFERLSSHFSELAEWLIVEFVPPDDDKVSSLPETAGKKLYNRENFERAFFCDFDCISEIQIKDSQRSILLFKVKK